MDNNANGWSGAEINYGGVNPAEVLMQGAAMNDRRKERDQQLAIQKARYQREDDDKKYAWAQSVTDPSKYISGQTAVDQHAQGAIADIQQQMVADIRNHNGDEGSLMAKYMPAIQAVAQGHLIAKQQLEQGYKQIDDASKDNPNLNTAALKQHVFNQVGQSVLDNQGNYRPADQIDPNRDIAGAVLNSPDAWQFSNGASGLIDGLRNMKGDKVNAITQQPNGTIVTHEGNITPFQKQDWNVGTNGFANKLPQFSLKTQPITLPDGKVAQALDSQTFDDQFGSGASKSNQMQFDYLWNRYKQHAGLNTTPQSEDYAKRIFAVQVVKDNVQNQMEQTHAEHLPRQPNISINMGNNAPVYDVYSDMVKAAQSRKGLITAGEMPQSGVEAVLPHLEKLWGKVKDSNDTMNPKDRDLTANDIRFAYSDDGKLRAINMAGKGESIDIDPTWINTKVNAAKADNSVIAEHNQSPAPAKPVATHTKTTTTTTDNKWDKYKRH